MQRRTLGRPRGLAVDSPGGPPTRDPARIGLGAWAIGGWMWGGSDDSKKSGGDDGEVTDVDFEEVND